MTAKKRVQDKPTAGGRSAPGARSVAASALTSSSGQGQREPEAAEQQPGAQQVRLTMGSDGRLLIPAEIRKQAGLTPGATVIAELRDGVITLSTWATRLRRLQSMFQAYRRPGVSEVDEFLAERRRMWGEED
jgi:bifunctional DNA-binding transcriptional regulator/antitoxin component of YhaV-PrlF toxin-antitoxin module